MTYEFRRVFFPWSWELTAKSKNSITPKVAEEYFRIFLAQIIPNELLGITLTSNKVGVDLVNFKGREPGEIIIQDEGFSPAREHELFCLWGELAESGEEQKSKLSIELTTPFSLFKGSDMVFRTSCLAEGALPEWALLGSLLSGLKFSISGLRAGATRYRKRFGSSLLGVSPVIEEQILIDYWKNEIAIEYRRYNLASREVPKDAWINALQALDVR
jgi:hypothetical protein